MPGDHAAHGFLYADGRMTDLGTLGGEQSVARAINDAGQITGFADIKSRHRRHAFLWQQGKMSDLGTSRADDSGGMAINGDGRVVGWVVVGGFVADEFGPTPACLWTDGKVRFLNSTDLGNSQCEAINDDGQVVGWQRELGRKITVGGMEDYALADHAMEWRGLRASELSAPGTEISRADAINSSGQVAGAVSVGKEILLHACVWQGGRMADLGTLRGQNTVVYALNRSGQMVGGTNPDHLKESGKAMRDDHQPQSAFCCSNGKLIDLNDLIDPASGWVLTEARGISDTGYVTGTGVHNGEVHAYLLKLPIGF